MPDQEQRTAHLLEQSEAGLVTASDTLRKAHRVLARAIQREHITAGQIAVARAYHAEALRYRADAERRMKVAIVALVLALLLFCMTMFG